MRTDIRYCMSDALLLAVIEHGGGKSGIDLRGIIATWDYMDHAIVTEKELAEGLWRLSEGGWIVEAKGGFKPSKRFKAKDIQYISPTGRRSVRKLHPQVRDLLGVDYTCREGSPSGVRYPGFTSEKFERAKKEYLDSH